MGRFSNLFTCAFYSCLNSLGISTSAAYKEMSFIASEWLVGCIAFNPLSYWIPVNMYFGKQCRPRCGISSGSALFAKIKTIFRDRIPFYRNFD